MDSPNSVVIETNNLSKTYKEAQALKSLNLTVKQNSIFGFLGPNGAGKSTTIKLLLGLIQPSGGQATVFGQDVQRDKIITLVCHPGAYTPDCQPILGPMPGARGFWNTCGMSLNGYGGAGGMGKLMAEWIVEGEPSQDVNIYRATRFQGDYYSNPEYAAERTREGVKYYYALRFPNDENEWARPHRVSPVHYRLQELGAVFGEKFGWERVLYFDKNKGWKRAGADQRQWGWNKPPYFDRLAEEHCATRERVALFDLTSFGKIETNVLNMLDLCRIPFFSKDRDERFPLIIAGGPTAFNPEPVADFFDAIVIGEGEEIVLEICDRVLEWEEAKGRKEDHLKSLSQIEGIYVPSLHPKDRKVRKRFVSDLNLFPVPSCPIVPYMKVVHDRLNLEIARGCKRGCRFCEAGFIYRPYRERSPKPLQEAIHQALRRTGYEEVSLLSLSAGDYSFVRPLLSHLMDRPRTSSCATSPGGCGSW